MTVTNFLKGEHQSFKVILFQIQNFYHCVYMYG